MSSISHRLKSISKTKMVLGLALLVGSLMSLMDLGDFNAIYEGKMLDLRFSWRDTQPPKADDKIILVAIDDQSLSALKVRWPWPRSIYAKAIQNLSRAGAKVVAFDLIFSGEASTISDAQDDLLAEAIRRAKCGVVLGSKFYTSVTDKKKITAFVSPLDKLDPEKERVGYVNFWQDEDGILRHGTLLHKHQGKLYQHFVLKVLAQYYQIKAHAMQLTADTLTYGPLKIAVEPGANLLINYRGGQGSFRCISFENVVDDIIFNGMAETDIFKDKIVLIGPTFTEAQDYHVTPYFREFSFTPGVEIHANMMDTILQGKYLRQISTGQRALLILCLPLLLALFNLRLRPLQSLLVLLAFLVAYSGLAIWVFNQHLLVLPMFNPILALFLSHMLILVYLLVTEELQSRRIKNLFSRYVSPKVVNQLVKNAGAELQMGGNRQVITVMFSDIRGFTTLSEQLAPEQVVELLNEYFQTMTEVIFKYDGTVDKFIGDAIMAIFGAPVAHPDDPIRAVMAALDMKAALAQLREKWTAEGKRVFEIGVGVNTGEAIVGNMGSHQAMGYTAIGDTVNLASRLESKNKELGTSILISESTYAAVRDKVQVKEHTDVTVKGKAKAMSAYEVLGIKP
jgi:adenylate cyclase